jgi:predicted helicase
MKMMSKNKQAQVFHFDLYGKREEKYNFLHQQSIDKIQWRELEVKEAGYFFIQKDFEEIINYDAFFNIHELFIEKGSGIKFRKDNLLVRFHYEKDSVVKMLLDMNELSNIQLKTKYNINDTYDWKIEEKRKLFAKGDDVNIVSINYRPFELRYTYYPPDKINQIIVRGDSRINLMQNLLNKSNIALLAPRQAITEKFGFFISNKICDINFTGVAGQYGAGLVFPLYLYHKIKGQTTLYQTTQRTPNLNQAIVKQIAELLGLTFTNEKEQTIGTFAPIDLLDYIYAVLHSPTYRTKYKEFLKIDFPRVPYPKDKDTFRQLVKLGGELRQIHLLESPVVETFITTFPIDGSGEVTKIKYEENKVWMNESQYFNNVPEVAWEFYIGGYQPAQKWLKDRKGRSLGFDDIMHYQKIIVALTETERIMKEIDRIEIE